MGKEIQDLKILSDEKGKKIILLGNEAIVRGALESGVGFASTYPGTPSSEVGNTFAEIAKDAGIYFEFSVNEKVALEAAAGAAFSGVRSMVSMKQFGLNVASDSFIPLAFVGPNAGMVIFVADDPNCWSSAQSEQDTRYYARLAHVPVLEPSDSQECKDFVKIAFKISEKFNIPVIVRSTTRVSHQRGVVVLDNLIRGKTKGFFLLKKNEKIRKISEKTKINFIVNKTAKSKLGVIVSGVSSNYIMDALEDLNFKLPVLKLGLTYPLPEKKIKNFIKRFKSVFIIEELEPILEESVEKLAKEVNPKLRIYGKNGYLPKSGEYTEELIISALEKITKRKFRIKLKQHSKRYKKLKLTRRFAVLCPGCPHRATFWAAKVAAGTNTIFGGDVGCYVLGIMPPYYTQDFMFSMGASEGIVHGIKKTTFQKAIAFVGDSTFFHAGMPGLVNIVYNKSNPLVIVLDNRITAMTGHQPNPGMGLTAMGEKTKEIKIEDIAKACQVKYVKVVDPFNVKKMIKTIKNLMRKKEASVIVAKRECQLLAIRKKTKLGIKKVKFMIDPILCKKCGTCLYYFACPAMYKEGDNFRIDLNLCTGCGVCAQICPNKAIKPVKKK